MTDRLVVFVPILLVFACTARAQTPAARRATVTVPQVNVRTEPALDAPRFKQLNPGDPIVVLGTTGEWARVRIEDGRFGWIGARYLLRSRAESQAAEPAKDTREPVSEDRRSGPVAGFARAESGAALNLGPVAGTKTETPIETKGSVFASAGNGSNMLLYLLPVLALTLLAIRGLRVVNIRLPVRLEEGKKGFLGSLARLNARKTGGSRIQVIESVSLAGIGLHLISVCGRTLLLGGSGSQVTLLTELDEPVSNGPSFASLLEGVREAPAKTFHGDAESPSAVVSALDDSIRKVREAIERKHQARAGTEPGFERW